MVSEHREYPRYTALFQVKINNLSISSINISLGGMQLSCDRMSGDMLKRRMKDDMAEVSIFLKKDLKVDATAKVAYISPYDEQEYLVGIEFETFHKDSRETLESYINENAGRTMKQIK